MSWFVVIRRRTDAWNDEVPLEDQVEWREHADFMEAMQAEGFCRLAGPLTGCNEALLVFDAESPAQIEQRLVDDPWTGTLLETVRISPWDLRLGRIG